jgi:hypothetical protein
VQTLLIGLLDPSARRIDEVADFLESEEGNSQRQDYVMKREFGAERHVHVVDQKISVLKIAEQRYVRSYTEDAPELYNSYVVRRNCRLDLPSNPIIENDRASQRDVLHVLPSIERERGKHQEGLRPLPTKPR